MKFSGVIFDLDGTLVDSETVSLESGVAAFSKFGWQADREFMLSLVGKDWPSCMKILEEKFGPADFEAVADTWRSETAKRARQITTKLGARTILVKLQAAGMPLAVATSSGPEGARKKLAMTGLDQFISVLVTRDDVANPKPAADPFLMAARLLSVEPKECLAIEDSHTGVTAAKAAGMFVVQVPDLLPAGGDADIVASSLEEALALAESYHR